MPVVAQFFAFKAQHKFSLDSASRKVFPAAYNRYRCFTNMSVLEMSFIVGRGKLIRSDGRFRFLPNTSVSLD